MPDKKDIVINTGPLLALCAGIGELDILEYLYSKVFVPGEVVNEINAGGKSGFAVAEFENAQFLNKIKTAAEISPHLNNSLDIGEASVIQTAINNNIDTVCIDETVGRRIARLYNLKVTGSIGVLLKAIEKGYDISVRNAIDRMQNNGIYLSDNVIRFALNKEREIKYLSSKN